MTIQDLGSLGELIAAFATILTLVYLAIQIRDSSRSTRFESHLRIRELAAESQKLLTDPALARLLREGLANPDGIGEDERISFNSLLFLMVNIDDARLVYKSANLDRNSSYLSDASPVDWMAGTPGFARWWEIARNTYSEDMIALVESKLKNRTLADR